jgi:hypothetical protein
MQDDTGWIKAVCEAQTRRTLPWCFNPNTSSGQARALGRTHGYALVARQYCRTDFF